MKRLSPKQLSEIWSKGRRKDSATLRDEIAGLSQGNPLMYDSFMGKTRYEMWMIALSSK